MAETLNGLCLGKCIKGGTILSGTATTFFGHQTAGLDKTIIQAATVVEAATGDLLVAVRAFDEERGWAVEGAMSCAHWLSPRLGIPLGGAREKVRVARALGALPQLDDALRRGQISYAKVRILTRVATPENEAEWLATSQRSTLTELGVACRQVAQARDRAVGQRKATRFLRVKDTRDGMVRIDVQLHPEEASRVLRAADLASSSRPHGVLEMADAMLRGDTPDRPPVEIVVHVDAATLSGHDSNAGMTADATRRLLCDADVAPLLESADGTPLRVGRIRRVISTALRDALRVRDGGCRFPGCTNRQRIAGHHVRHWLDGGETNLSNTITLCTFHHDLVHDGRIQVSGDGQTLSFRTCDGREISTAVASDPSDLDWLGREELPIWDGTFVDHEIRDDWEFPSDRPS